VFSFFLLGGPELGRKPGKPCFLVLLTALGRHIGPKPLSEPFRNVKVKERCELQSVDGAKHFAGDFHLDGESEGWLFVLGKTNAIDCRFAADSNEL
jgi:hypothetical protein